MLLRHDEAGSESMTLRAAECGQLRRQSVPAWRPIPLRRSPARNRQGFLFEFNRFSRNRKLDAVSAVWLRPCGESPAQAAHAVTNARDT